MVLANRAKHFGCKEVADAIFGIFINLFFEGVARNVPTCLQLKVETRDPKGEAGPDESYYDLITFMVEEVKGMSLCIPAPLVDKPTMAACYKYAAAHNGFGYREVHERSHEDLAPPVSRDVFLRELRGIVPEKAIRHASRNLSPELAKPVLAAINGAPQQETFGHPL